MKSKPKGKLIAWQSFTGHHSRQYLRHAMIAMFAQARNWYTREGEYVVNSFKRNVKADGEKCPVTVVIVRYRLTKEEAAALSYEPETVEQQMTRAFKAGDPQLAADVIGKAWDNTERDNRMIEATRAGFACEFYPVGGGIGVRVWMPGSVPATEDAQA